MGRLSWHKKIKFKGKSRQSLNSKAVMKRKRNKEQKYISFLAFLSNCCKLRYHTYLGSESGPAVICPEVHKNYFFTIYPFQFFLVKWLSGGGFSPVILLSRFLLHPNPSSGRDLPLTSRVVWYYTVN